MTLYPAVTGRADGGRLTSFERLQIYARCYWFRLIEGVQQDCPALRALLGEKKFAALTKSKEMIA